MKAMEALSVLLNFVGKVCSGSGNGLWVLVRRGVCHAKQ